MYICFVYSISLLKYPIKEWFEPKRLLNFQLYVEEIQKDCVLKIIKSVWKWNVQCWTVLFFCGQVFLHGSISEQHALRSQRHPNSAGRWPFTLLQVTHPPINRSKHQHTPVSKYALTENMYIQRITDTSQWVGDPINSQEKIVPCSPWLLHVNNQCSGDFRTDQLASCGWHQVVFPVK